MFLDLVLQNIFDIFPFSLRKKKGEGNFIKVFKEKNNCCYEFLRTDKNYFLMNLFFSIIFNRI